MINLLIKLLLIIIEQELLMEIVSYPDLSDWVEAGDYLTKLRSI